jgi:hypothetical protein
MPAMTTPLLHAYGALVERYGSLDDQITNVVTFAGQANRHDLDLKTIFKENMENFVVPDALLTVVSRIGHAALQSQIRLRVVAFFVHACLGE